MPCRHPHRFVTALLFVIGLSMLGGHYALSGIRAQHVVSQALVAPTLIQTGARSPLLGLSAERQETPAPGTPVVATATPTVTPEVATSPPLNTVSTSAPVMVAPTVTPQQSQSSSGGTSILLSVVVAVFTVVIALANMLLWMTTRENVDVMRENLKVLSEQSAYLQSLAKTQTLYSITGAHRSMFLAFLSNERALSLLARSAETAPDVYATSFIASLLINHVSDVYRSVVLGQLDSNEWGAMQSDIRDMFSWPIVKSRWEAVASFYPKDFREYIAALLESTDEYSI